MFTSQHFVFYTTSIIFPAPLSSSGALAAAASADRLETGSIITMTSDERVQGGNQSQNVVESGQTGLAD